MTAKTYYEVPPKCLICHETGRWWPEYKHTDLIVVIWRDHECCDTFEPQDYLKIDEMTDAELKIWGITKTLLIQDGIHFEKGEKV